MRKLVYFTIGFGISCGILAYGVAEIGREIGIAVFGLAVVTGILGIRGKFWKRAAFLLLGCGLGMVWFGFFDSFYLNTAVSMDGKTENVTIRAGDYSYETDYGIAVDGTVELDGRSYQVRAYLDERKGIAPGETLTGEFRFRVTTPDGEEESTYHPGKGIFLLAYQRDEVKLGKSEEKWMDRPAKLRYGIKNSLKTCFPEVAYPFVLALLLGDTSELDYETDTDFKISGIRHVVAVSGLHVSILFALISTITFKKRFLTAFFGVPALFLFAAVAGFTPSVTRACIMSGLMLVALLLDKEYDGGTALAFAALVMLFANPMVITSVSFQLSVASVSGIYLFEANIKNWLLGYVGETKGKKIKAVFVNWFTTSVSISLSAMVLTTPLCAVYFGAVSLVSAVTNLLALWVISFIFYGIIAVLLVQMVWQSGALLGAKVVALAVRWVLWVAEVMADIPLAAVYTRSPYIAAWVVFVYVLLVVFLLSRNKRPGVLGCCAVLGLCFALLASWGEPMLDEFRFTVLDVGQGQCLLVQSEGRNYMIDCGGDSDAKTADIAAETLLSQGITALDGLILTHLDRDHAGAAGNLLTRVDTRLLILPEEHTELGCFTEGEVVYACDDLKLAWGNTVLSIFAPTFPGNSNEKSLCLLFDTEICDILITGDRSGFGERSLLRNETIPDVDILVAGHHGSRNSTCEELLSAVLPETVCISAGEGNSYGHPAPETLERLQKFGCTVYRTDLHRTITIRR